MAHGIRFRRRYAGTPVVVKERPVRQHKYKHKHEHHGRGKPFCLGLCAGCLGHKFCC
ncbi:hypothetical protein IWW55_001786 [Coemansia sp. RSA 2706]|nr:hypothetical protein IWW55_001786 [Coemansia sp. RSA 2706]